MKERDVTPLRPAATVSRAAASRLRSRVAAPAKPANGRSRQPAAGRKT
jgi:hypothetical protein